MSTPENLSPAAVTADLLAVAPKATGGPETAQPPAPVQPVAETAPAGEPIRDRLGRDFDAKRFRTGKDGKPFLNARGEFMPRGGKKAGSTASNAKVTASEPPPISGPVPTGSAWSEAEKAAASQPLPPPAGEGEPAGKTVEPEVVGSADDSAEVACRAIYTTLGFLTDAPEEATPTPAEHKNMQSMTAAYFRSRGWIFAGGVAVCIALLAYLLRLANKPKTREKVRGWFGRERPVTDQGEPPPAASPRTSPPSPPAPPATAALTVETVESRY